ncbi:MFS transporter [Bacillus horti]|uniref:MFS family permease n=1 Tax=Caldalkalibacillus horti TaxID=77523 RepID=A0ABT9VXG8_9BACI|nr:MFS transporter [Bacillus horti]MDQ0165684.1 MFS family permease [Bacillus horti]
MKVQKRKALWKQSNFFFLFSSQVSQSMAFILLQVVVMVEIYAQTGSVFGSSLVPAINAFGLFIGGVLGSYYMQHFSEVRLLQSIGLLRAAIVVALGFVLFSDSTALVVLLTLLFLQALAGSWYQPARFSLLPRVVSKAQYMKANGTLAMIHQMFMTAGWALGGVLVVWLPLSWMIGLVSFLFAFSGIAIGMIKIAKRVDIESDLIVKSVEMERAEIEGAANTGEARKQTNKPFPAWRKVFTYPIIRTVTIMDFFENLANVIWASAFLLIFTTEILGKGTEWWGFINASYWVGAIIGSVTILSITSILEKRLGTVIAISSLVMCLMTLLFALIPIPWLALIVCVLMGPVYQAREICQETIMQDVLEEKERANVMAARSALLTPWSSLTFLIMGFIGEKIGIQWVFILGGALYGLTFIVAIFQKKLLEYKYVVDEVSLLD